MLSTEFEAATPAIIQLQIYALDLRATGINKEELFYTSIIIAVFFWLSSPQWFMAPSFLRFLDHTQRRTTVPRTPFDE
jgi:hypothetical protein